MEFLNTIEALNSVIIHSIELIGPHGWNRLHETNHSAVAMSVEFIIISGLKGLELVRAILDWILGDFRFDCIFEIGEESEAIVELNLESLIIDWRPCTWYKS